MCRQNPTGQSFTLRRTSSADGACCVLGGGFDHLRCGFQFARDAVEERGKGGFIRPMLLLDGFPCCFGKRLGRAHPGLQESNVSAEMLRHG